MYGTQTTPQKHPTRHPAKERSGISSSARPLQRTASVTAGLKWAPETSRKASESGDSSLLRLKRKSLSVKGNRGQISGILSLLLLSFDGNKTESLTGTSLWFATQRARHLSFLLPSCARSFLVGNADLNQRWSSLKVCPNGPETNSENQWQSNAMRQKQTSHVSSLMCHPQKITKTHP